jgi:hypothetical protein
VQVMWNIPGVNKAAYHEKSTNCGLFSLQGDEVFHMPFSFSQCYNFKCYKFYTRAVHVLENFYSSDLNMARSQEKSQDTYHFLSKLK